MLSSRYHVEKEETTFTYSLLYSSFTSCYFAFMKLIPREIYLLLFLRH